MATAGNPAELKDTLAQYEAQYDQVTSLQTVLYYLIYFRWKLH